VAVLRIKIAGVQPAKAAKQRLKDLSFNF